MYSHDITHCNNENCKNKDTCYRYLAHLEAKEKKYTYLNTAGTAGIKACGDMSKDTCAAHEAHESLAHG